MSDEKPKPFAEARPINDGRDAVLYVGGHAVYDIDRAEAEQDALDINAAVEQREAKLRGPLRALMAHAIDLCLASRDAHDRSMSSAPWGWPDPMAVESACDEALAALGPNPPAYVPAAELDAAIAKVKQLQAAADAIDTVEGDAFFSADDKRAAVAAVCAHLEAAGLRKPQRETTDASVRAEALMDALTVVMREGESYGAIQALRRLCDEAFAKAAGKYIAPPPIGDSPALREARHDAMERRLSYFSEPGVRSQRNAAWDQRVLVAEESAFGSSPTWGHRCPESGNNGVGLSLDVAECPSCGEERPEPLHAAAISTAAARR